LVVMIGIRKSLDFFFTRRELKILDDVMPETSKRSAEEKRKNKDDDDDEESGEVLTMKCLFFARYKFSIFSGRR